MNNKDDETSGQFFKRFLSLANKHLFLQNVYTIYNTLWIPALVLQKCSKILLLVKTEEKAALCIMKICYTLPIEEVEAIASLIPI